MPSMQQSSSHKTSSKGRSLGVGSLSIDGRIVLELLYRDIQHVPKDLEELGQRNAAKIDASFRKSGNSVLNLLPSARTFHRMNSSFLRVADLKMEDKTNATHDMSESESEMSHPNFTHVAVDPPPGVDLDPKELWVVLDDGAGSHAPIAPVALEALAKTGLGYVLDDAIWTCYRSPKHMKATPWYSCTWQQEGLVSLPPPGSPGEDTVLVWSGKFMHGGYGSELPAVRAAGIIHSPAKALFELLVDSSRVKEYNSLSLGRDDLLVLQEDMYSDGPFGRSITKVMRSKSMPPLVRKTMELVSILYARELEDGSGYLLVTRAVTLPEHSNGASGSSLRSEILMGVNVIRKVEGEDDRCLMITVTHIRSPMVPLFIASKIGASSAANFIKEVRSVSNLTN